MKARDITPGSTIGMLDGVVKFEGYAENNDGTITIFVSMGRLKNHPVKRHPETEFTVYNVPDDIAPWYGV